MASRKGSVVCSQDLSSAQCFFLCVSTLFHVVYLFETRTHFCLVFRLPSTIIQGQSLQKCSLSVVLLFQVLEFSCFLSELQLITVISDNFLQFIKVKFFNSQSLSQILLGEFS